MSIDKIRNIGLDKLVTQVYDFDSLTTDELLCKFAQKINIIIEHLKYVDDRCYNSDKALEEKLQYLLGQGLEEQVAKRLLELINNGTMGKLINQTLLKEINDKVDTLASVELNLLNLGFKFDGTDESEKLNNLLSTLTSQSVTLLFPQGKSINLKNITFNSSRFLTVKGNNCIINCDNNDYVFVNNNNTMLLNVENLVINGNGGLCNFQLSGNGSGKGTKLYARNIEFRASNRTATGINMKATDFMNVENIIAYNMATVININSNLNNGERTNTQINIRNLNIHTSNYGLVLNGVDKINCTSLDCNRVSTGLYIGKQVTRATFTNYHCEYFGNYDTGNDDGFGIKIAGRANKNVKFNECSVFLPATNAKYGIYIDDDYVLDDNYNQVKFDNVYVQNYSQDGYIPIKLSGYFEYNGNVKGMDGTKIILNTTNNKTNIGIIKPTDIYNLPVNMFNKTKIDSSEYFDLIEGGTPEISVVNSVATIINSSGQSSRVSKSILLESGWYTAIINGKMNNNRFKVEMKTSPWTTILTRPCPTDSAIIYFYVTTSAVYKVQFEISDGSSIIINDFVLKKGFSSNI